MQSERHSTPGPADCTSVHFQWLLCSSLAWEEPQRLISDGLVTPCNRTNIDELVTQTLTEQNPSGSTLWWVQFSAQLRRDQQTTLVLTALLEQFYSGLQLQVVPAALAFSNFQQVFHWQLAIFHITAVPIWA